MIILINIGQKQVKDCGGNSVLVDGFLLNGKLTGPGTYEKSYGKKYESNWIADKQCSICK